MMKRGIVKCVVAGFLCLSGMGVLAAVPAWTPLFKGIDHAVLVESAPLVNVLRIDTHDPDIVFQGTASNGGSPLDTDRQTVSDFLLANGVQVAINANFFTNSTPTEADLLGLVVTEGQLVSPGEGAGGQPSAVEELRISQANVATYNHFPDLVDPTNNVWTAIAGGTLVYKSAVWGYSDTSEHPRTAVGLSYDQRYLYLLTADGRQSYNSVWYEGTPGWEVGEWLVDCGAYYGLMLDGGGSTTLAMDDGAGGATLMNVPVDGVSGPGDAPGTERAIGNCLGIFALPITPQMVFLDSGFEDDDTATAISIKDSSVTAWETTSTEAQPDIRQEGYWGPAEAHGGEQHCYLGGKQAIYQNFTNTYVEGMAYELTYWVQNTVTGSAGNTYAYFTDGSGTGEYGGALKSGIVHDKGVGVDRWQQCRVSYTATAADVGETIGFGIYGSVYIYIDDVVFGASTATTELGDPGFEFYMPNNLGGVNRGYDYVGNLYNWGRTHWGSPSASYIADVINHPELSGPDTTHSGNQWAKPNGQYMHQALPGSYVRGGTYTLSFWVSTDTATGQGGYLYFTDGAFNNGYIGDSNEAYLGNNSGSGMRYYVDDTDYAWVEQTFTFTPSAAVAGKQIGISIHGYGDTFIDDVSVSYVPPGETEVVDPDYEVTLPNGDPGERGYDYVGNLYNLGYTDWGSPDGVYIADTTVYAGAGPSTAHSGDKWVDLNGYSVHQALLGTYVEGEQYTLTVWATADTSNQTISVGFTDGSVANGYIGAADAWAISGSEPATFAVPDTGFAWSSYSHSYTATAADAGKTIGISIYGASATYLDGVVTVSATLSDPEIIGFTKVSGNVYEIELACPPSLKGTTYPLKRTDLVVGSWGNVPHATSSAGPFTTITNVNYSATSGEGNPVIYVESIDDEAFFGLGQ